MVDHWRKIGGGMVLTELPEPGEADHKYIRAKALFEEFIGDLAVLGLSASNNKNNKLNPMIEDDRTLVIGDLTFHEIEIGNDE